MNSQLVTRFRGWADALQPKIDHAFRSLTQNPTPKRNAEYASRRHDGRNMERTQKALRCLADSHESGSVPTLLSGLKTKDEISKLVRKYIDSSKGGYYTRVESDDYADTSPAGRLLQSLIEGNGPERAELQRARKLDELQAAIALSKIPGFFPTPAAVCKLMLERAELGPGMTVLEPSAGSGFIADFLACTVPDLKMDVVEHNSRLREVLELKGYNLVGSDFLEDDFTGRQYDRILMNPPFEKQADIDHVQRAASLLAPGGVLVAVMSASFDFRQDKKSAAFREWLGVRGAEWCKLPEGSFKESGTGVNAYLVSLARPALAENPEMELRALYEAQGVAPEVAEHVTSEAIRKAQPEYLANVFPVRATSTGQLLLF